MAKHSNVSPISECKSGPLILNGPDFVSIRLPGLRSPLNPRGDTETEQVKH